MTHVQVVLLVTGCANLGLICLIAYGDKVYRKYLVGIGYGTGLLNPFKSPTLPIPEHKEIARIVAIRKRIHSAYIRGYKNGQIARQQQKSDL